MWVNCGIIAQKASFNILEERLSIEDGRTSSSVTIISDIKALGTV